MKMNPKKKINRGYQLSVGISPHNGRTFSALFKDGNFLAEASDFKSLDDVLKQLHHKLNRQNQEPISEDASLEIVNGRFWLYQSQGYERLGCFNSANKISLNDEEIRKKYFSAQQREIERAYIDWKFGFR